MAKCKCGGDEETKCTDCQDSVCDACVTGKGRCEKCAKKAGEKVVESFSKMCEDILCEGKFTVYYKNAASDTPKAIELAKNIIAHDEKEAEKLFFSQYKFKEPKKIKVTAVKKQSGSYRRQ